MQDKTERSEYIDEIDEKLETERYVAVVIVKSVLIALLSTIASLLHRM